jgi:hypothetical protein
MRNKNDYSTEEKDKTIELKEFTERSYSKTSLEKHTIKEQAFARTDSPD